MRPSAPPSSGSNARRPSYAGNRTMCAAGIAPAKAVLQVVSQPNNFVEHGCRSLRYGTKDA